MRTGPHGLSPGLARPGASRRPQTVALLRLRGWSQVHLESPGQRRRPPSSLLSFLPSSASARASARVYALQPFLMPPPLALPVPVPPLCPGHCLRPCPCASHAPHPRQRASAHFLPFAVSLVRAGNGGKGGSVLIQATPRRIDFKHVPGHVKAQDGGKGKVSPPPPVPGPCRASVSLRPRGKRKQLHQSSAKKAQRRPQPSQHEHVCPPSDVRARRVVAAVRSSTP